jgi:hypothetical protein
MSLATDVRSREPPGDNQDCASQAAFSALAAFGVQECANARRPSWQATALPWDRRARSHHAYEKALVAAQERSFPPLWTTRPRKKGDHELAQPLVDALLH